MATSKRSSQATGQGSNGFTPIRYTLFAVVAVSLCCFANRGAFEQRFIANAQDEPVKLKTTLVQVPVVVSDRGGRYVTDLQRGDFQLFEDGVSQPIEFFKSIDEPFTVALLLDSSGSTSDQLNQIKSAALAFIDNLRERDR